MKIPVLSGRLLLFASAGLLIGQAAIAAEPDVAANNRFTQTVAPILQKHCLSCHNTTTAKGKFSLTTRDDLFTAGYVDVNEPADSYLLELITPHNGRAEMPRDGQALSAADRMTIQKWIAAGAHWPQETRLQEPVVADRNWWSLKPLQQPTIPDHAVEQHPVDAFLQAILTEKNLQPLGSAPPKVLIRRLTYDLTGLPPTPAEVDAFLRDHARNADAAWQTLVDRLLASPAFGEKFAQHWLDVARYAETHGYDKDKPREQAWPYRDYVIRSFNTDKPYARFVQEQVAGDALFPGSEDGVLGLGFLAAGPWDFIAHQEVGEGKLDGRVAKHLDRDEMLAATFNVFMSTTIQCAQCHHHKFDPLRMQDYYRLHAVFAAVDRAPRVYSGLSPDREREKKLLLARVRLLTADRSRREAELQQKISQQAGPIERRLAELTQNAAPPLPGQYGYHSQIIGSPDQIKWVQLDLGKPQRVSQIQLRPAYDNYANIGPGFGFPVRYRVEAADDADFKTNVQLLHDATARDQPNPGTLPVTIAVDKATFRYLRVTATKLAERKQDYIFALAELEVQSADDNRNLARDKAVTVTALDSIEAPVRWGRSNLVDGVFYQELADPQALAKLHKLRRQRASIAATLRTPAFEKELQTLTTQIDDLNTRLQSFPVGQRVYAVTTDFPRQGNFAPTNGQQRVIHLLHRGDHGSPGARMLPGVPALWQDADFTLPNAVNANESLARAELARYLTRRDNPLVWRSIANRVWAWTFNQPLVDTPNDFGRGGQQPTHPALLDWLATRLRDDPQQSLKSLVRLLVTSRAYRRVSAAHPQNARSDAGNRFYWRRTRRRLTAEELRDSLLAISGALRQERGGPSFRDFVIVKPEHSPHYEYHLHDPADTASHRRSVYRFVVRSQPQPLLTTLDCADPSISVPRREESTTALQALARWNNRFVVEMSVRLADRIEREAPTDNDSRVEFACRMAFGRPPSLQERQVLVKYLQTHGLPAFARVVFNTSALTYVD